MRASKKSRNRREEVLEIPTTVIPSEGEKEWEVWSEGYAATGERANASLHGKAIAKTFEEACTIVFGKPTKDVWGCRLFDNEVDARKGFG